MWAPKPMGLPHVSEHADRRYKVLEAWSWSQVSSGQGQDGRASPKGEAAVARRVM